MYYYVKLYIVYVNLKKNLNKPLKKYWILKNLDVTQESFISQLDQRSFESRDRIDKNNK